MNDKNKENISNGIKKKKKSNYGYEKFYCIKMKSKCTLILDDSKNQKKKGNKHTRDSLFEVKKKKEKKNSICISRKKFPLHSFSSLRLKNNFNSFYLFCSFPLFYFFSWIENGSQIVLEWKNKIRDMKNDIPAMKQMWSAFTIKYVKSRIHAEGRKEK